ncbi:hypothetical protein MMC21_006666 [Puttea exsequens]|nr:hypothetical protein [Puttea exsequens]
MAQLPTLPHGSPSLVSGLSETFAFHSSPESFVTSRVLAFQASNPSLAKSRTPIRAKVLNRNVAVISSYGHVRQLLCDEGLLSKLSSANAYDELMAPFFPPPNLLLSDPPGHREMKETWMGRMESLPDTSRTMVGIATRSHFQAISSGSSIDLYESMKTLSWKLVLGIFLSGPTDLTGAPKDTEEIEKLQEDLLRGQFSLIPVSINTRFWQSPRSKGLAARQRLQEMLTERVTKQASGCPFVASGADEKGDIASHMLLFTSSLAVKALASLLTAVLLNLYAWGSGKRGASSNLASKIGQVSGEGERNGMIKSLLLETERLSPPVVGIMRRSTLDVVLSGARTGVEDTLIPRGWDTWLYYVGAARDPAVFGDTAELFMPERYLHDKAEQGFAFGAGPKFCLGQDLMREVVMTVMKVLLNMDNGASKAQKSTISMQFNAAKIAIGVQGWLGWQADVKPEDWARDMKQLPTQRPLRPVFVSVHHEIDRQKSWLG